MSVWSLAEFISEARLRCPTCHSTCLQVVAETLRCSQCNAEYRSVNSVPFFAPAPGGIKSEIQNFWSDLYQQLYTDYERELGNISPTQMETLLDECLPMLQHMEHLPVREIQLTEIAGRQVLEVGCGAGTHSAIFKRHGAHVVALDLAPARVMSAQRKLGLVRPGYGCAVQGDAEELPFDDATFDIVYSFGVLHHTENTERAIGELYRVLKPGGQVAVMLYAKSSFYYWVNLFFVQGILKRNLAHGARWLGRVTEGVHTSTVLNPITRVYTKSEMLRLFTQFHALHLRKNGFNFSQIPWLGNRLETLLVKIGICETSHAGLLIWDRPLRLETQLELGLGHFMGFGWNVRGIK